MDHKLQNVRAEKKDKARHEDNVHSVVSLMEKSGTQSTPAQSHGS